MHRSQHFFPTAAFAVKIFIFMELVDISSARGFHKLSKICSWHVGEAREALLPLASPLPQRQSFEIRILDKTIF